MAKAKVAAASRNHAQHGKIIIRRAGRADGPALLRLIVALAKFEKLPPPDAKAQQRLIEDGFGKRPRFECWLAFCEGISKPIVRAWSPRTGAPVSDPAR